MLENNSITRNPNSVLTWTVVDLQAVVSSRSGWKALLGEYLSDNGPQTHFHCFLD